MRLDFATIAAAYASGALTPEAVVREVLRRIAAAGEDHVWISRRSDDDLLAEAAGLGMPSPEKPLFGLPFAVKDNIDAVPLPTTAACPDFAHVPAVSAPVVARLVAAGAILVGKTNLDQFATGLVGTRSPYGVPRNPFDPARIPGGSSSGSAVAVSSGLVAFALGTDTAGSGRVPAAFNGLVGLKPTRGLFSTRGVVPACRSLDCVSVFAHGVDDAAEVAAVLAGFDAEDPYSRPAPPGFSPRPAPIPPAFRFGVPRPDQRRFFGDAETARLFEAAIARAETIGGTAVEIDFAPWYACAALLYGPFVAERTEALAERLRDAADTLHPVTRAILEQGKQVGGPALFRAQHELARLAQAIRPVWQDLDFVLVPTAGTCWTLAEVAADPIGRNADLGITTNFTNLLDLAAIAIPAGITASGLPAGVTLLAPAWHDGRLAGFARAMQGAPVVASRPAVHPRVDLAVFGAHLAGQPLNPALRALGGRLVRPCRTEPCYRMVVVPGPLPRPGLIPAEPGAALDGEIWSLPTEALAAFLATILPPLGLGTVRLESGPCLGFICETLTAPAPDITASGGWRAYVGGQS